MSSSGTEIAMRERREVPIEASGPVLLERADEADPIAARL